MMFDVHALSHESILFRAAGGGANSCHTRTEAVGYLYALSRNLVTEYN